MRHVLIGVLLLALVGCGGEDLEQVRAEAREGMVDECYELQARAYKRAAEYARDSIQTYLPEILHSTADVVGAASDRDLQAMERAGDDLAASGDEFMGTGNDFEQRMAEAARVCD
jgi:Tfp pilus assembly protein PilP